MQTTILFLLLLLTITIAGGVLYRVRRWLLAKLFHQGVLGKPAKIVESRCPACNETNITWQVKQTHIHAHGRRVANSLYGGRGLVDNHVNCIDCGAVYRVR